jgi:LuxR family transcriptional regulator, regulator of acetate metabolism
VTDERARRADTLHRATLAAVEALEAHDDVAAARSALRALDDERDLRRSATAARAERHEAIRRSLTRLRRARTPIDLLHATCPAVVDGCGFSRAMLSRIDLDVWHPWMVHFDEDRDGGRTFLGWIEDREVRLEQLPLERAVVDGRAPELVLDAPSDPRTYAPFVEAGRLRSYVVAPVVPAGRVIGLLHADHGPHGLVDEEDRLALSVFAEAVGRLYERLVILERMGAHRHYVRETFEIAETLTGTLERAEIELRTTIEDDLRPFDDVVADPVEVSKEVEGLLTAREREVLAMMVRGYSNAEIGERLVITVGTVKSHVKRILRKVGAVNRSQAISRYADAPPPD